MSAVKDLTNYAYKVVVYSFQKQFKTTDEKNLKQFGIKYKIIRKKQQSKTVAMFIISMNTNRKLKLYTNI